jgi:8-oxo-dGTP pyrophosphatase MutT (NUDIX family)
MHTHKGIYFICSNADGLLLTIKKGGGPYKNRLDLPGGTPEDGETEFETVVREVLEETGYTIQSAAKIGEKVYQIPWNYKHWTTSSHTAVYFQGNIDETLTASIAEIPDQDSLGALWVDPLVLKEDWCSPLVWEAVDFLKTNQLVQEKKLFKDWEVLDTPRYLTR